MHWMARCLPKSLVGRVFALYTLALALFVGAGVALFFRFQFAREIEASLERADGLVGVVAPAVADSAVIGDYDTIKRTLEHAIAKSDFAYAAFIDLRDGTLKVERGLPPEVVPPAWLLSMVSNRLYDTNRPIVVGGRDYGVLRLRYAAEQIAGDLWRQARAAVVLAAAGLACGLLLIWLPLKQWLGNVGRLQSFEAGMRAGRAQPAGTLAPDAPIEFQRTFEVLNRASATLQSQREQALAALRGVLEGLLPRSSGRRDVADDIEAISHMISQLVQRMQEHSNQLSAIFALSPDGFVSFDGHRAVSYVSPAFTRLTGLDESDVLGLTEPEFARLLGVRCLGPRAEFPSFDALRTRQHDGGRSSGRRCFVEVERPLPRTLELALRLGEGGNISQVLHLRDVTLESEVDRMKSEFLSTAAHELRTPMASIYGFSELMMHRRLTPQRQQEVIATIYRQTGLMIAIVNELLDLARIEARRGKDFVIETLDLGTLAGEVLHDFKPPNEREPPTLARPPGSLAVKVDRGKFSQALGNVLSNAYKYSPGGGPVHVSIEPDAGRSRAALRVRDAGIGMTPEQLARVCERFYRADASGSIPGTGLGMSIVKEIIELLGGTLELQSEAGVGTQVTCWLPLAAGDMAAPLQPAADIAQQMNPLPA